MRLVSSICAIVGIKAARFFNAQRKLDVGDLEPVGVEIDRHLDDIRNLMQVLAVHYGVDRQRQVKLARPFRNLDLLRVRVLQAGDTVGHHRFVALEADLHVTEPGVGQIRQFFPGQQHR